MNILIVIISILMPTLFTTGAYLLVGMKLQGIPSILLFYIMMLFILVPMEWYMVIRAGKKQFGNVGLKAALYNQVYGRLYKVILWAFILFGWAGLMSVTIAPLENKLFAPVNVYISSILPTYFDWSNLALLKQYSSGVLYTTLIAYFICNVFIGPITEEFFFRGYLTNKLEKLGIWAPILVSILFSLYHFWLPTNNLFRILTFGPVAVIAWKKKDIRISIYFHCLCNLFSTVSYIISVLAIT